MLVSDRAIAPTLLSDDVDENLPTTLNVGPTRRIGIRLVIHGLTRLLTLVHIA